MWIADKRFCIRYLFAHYLIRSRHKVVLYIITIIATIISSIARVARIVYHRAIRR